MLLLRPREKCGPNRPKTPQPELERLDDRDVHDDRSTHDHADHDARRSRRPRRPRRPRQGHQEERPPGDHRHGLARFRSTAKMLSPKHWQDPYIVSLHRSWNPIVCTTQIRSTKKNLAVGSQTCTLNAESTKYHLKNADPPKSKPRVPCFKRN